jgi:hypothetical protein
MTAPEAPDFTLTRLELLDWAQRQAAHIASTLAMAGHCQHCFYFREGHFTSWRACFLPAGFITPMELTMDDEAAFALIAVMVACGLFLMMLRVL